MARMQAEFDNARKREAKERADFRDYAVGNAAESFLTVLDNFQLALKSQGSPEQFRAGIELIAKQFDEAVRNLGVTALRRSGSSLTRACMRHWARSRQSSFRTAQWSTRSVAATASRNVCCVPHWSAWP